MHTARILFRPPVLSVFLDDSAVPVLESVVDLSIVLDQQGRAWVGFTASTGGGYENHDILNCSFTGTEVSSSLSALRPAKRIKASTAEQQLKRSTLIEWVENLRLVTTDGVAQHRSIDRVYAHIANGSPAQTYISDFYRRNQPFTRAQTETVSVDIQSVL